MRKTVGITAGVAAAVAIGLFALSCSDSTAPGLKEYVANPTAALEQPPKTTTATANVTFTDEGTDILWTMAVSNITNVTASHIHLGSTAVASGPVIFNLYLPIRPPETGTLNGVVMQGTITNASNPSISLDSLRVLMNNGNAYVNIHTTANPGGEIRDQIRAQ